MRQTCLIELDPGFELYRVCQIRGVMCGLSYVGLLF